METVNLGLIGDAGLQLDRATSLLLDNQDLETALESLRATHVALTDLVQWARQVNRAISGVGVDVDDLPID